MKSVADRPTNLGAMIAKGGKVIIQGYRNTHRLQLWFVCTSKDFVGITGIQVVLSKMDTSSESTMSSAPAQFVKTDIRSIKKKIKRINRYLRRIDTGGGCRLEIIDMDMV